jgi:hypothetical protein
MFWARAKVVAPTSAGPYGCTDAVVGLRGWFKTVSGADRLILHSEDTGQDVAGECVEALVLLGGGELLVPCVLGVLGADALAGQLLLDQRVLPAVGEEGQGGGVGPQGATDLQKLLGVAGGAEEAGQARWRGELEAEQQLGDVAVLAEGADEGGGGLGEALLVQADQAQVVEDGGLGG